MDSKSNLPQLQENEPDYKRLYLDLLNATEVAIEIIATHNNFFKEHYLPLIQKELFGDGKKPE